jgi:ubiquinone/menaquinone biosynthesis C-methylase UbiE
VLDSGTGTGALALALAPLVREVVGIDLVAKLLEEARQRAGAFPNVSFLEADATSLPFAGSSFDVAASHKTLHHVARPELAVAELARVTRSGGLVLVIDQIAPVDPMAAVELNRFERARDPSHARALADVDLRSLFEANNLVIRRTRFDRERRELESYLDLAGCEGEQREEARSLAPPGYTATIGWYLAVKPGFAA